MGLSAFLTYYAESINWRTEMKKFALAAAFAGAASTAFAGNMSEPVIEMDPVVVVEETAAGSSGAGLIVPLIIVALIAAAASN